ncbi:chemotaxis protein CheB [Siphonobacter sp. SORGH_AS_0500]|uniref:chemotaxis protein CheB n=1 Tax=Siphonobacter sp. SORGH_AS_0500 TaxID=1864824 RepID=UPI0028604688|nr:chemotaxis protein CheB [Siphonobacter sp. SORGH_AS_0500]MDR6194379.1 two-component system chemotaxis response regulator CheB [Siphonobacter sp. SORGH_AS_0500]
MRTKILPEIVVIGGSAGCFPVVLKFLEQLPETFPFALILVLHRQKSGPSEMDKVLSLNKHTKVIEPNDKDPILPNQVYLAPQNYHLLEEDNRSVSLDYSETIHYSRPSLDPTFESAGDVYAHRAAGILLSGSNHDGAEGLAHLAKMGGQAFIQNPAFSSFPAMPLAGLQLVPNATLVKPSELINSLFSI